MTRRLGRIVLVVAVAVAALVAVGIVLDTGDTPSRGPISRGASVDLSGVPTGSVGNVTALATRVEEVPGDWTAWASLAMAHVERARTTGDPAQYELAEAAIQRSLEIRPNDNLTAMLATSGLAAARHDFEAALVAADTAVAIAPANAAAHGARADALTELGRYDDAEDAAFAALDRRPGVANLARASYQFELRGKTERAVDAMQRAADLATQPADVAFTRYHLGTLAFARGDLVEAERRFEDAHAAHPTWVAPSAGLAKVAAARGDLDTARARYGAIVEELPLPEYVADAAELAVAAGDTDGAADLYELLDAQRALMEAGGVNVDLEVALAEADRGQRPQMAVEIARSAWQRRHSVHVADALGWALYVAGEHEQALEYARYAVSLGTRSASFNFHLGMIEAAVGNRQAARAALETALELNPSFSPRWAPVARETRASLR